MKSSPTSDREIAKAAIASRLVVASLILLWRSLLDPYDTSSPLNPNCLSSSSSSLSREENGAVFLPLLGAAIENSVVWDGVYFLRIAECGYEYEQTYAFLPLLPIFISTISNTVFKPLIPVIGLRAVRALSGYIVNNLAFVLAAIYFYKLSVLVLKDRDAAMRASVLFCFNPAAIFYSSIYSESLYSLFSIGGLYYLISGSDTISVVWFALSGCARSNGVLNAGYFCFQTMHRAYDAVFVKKRPFLAVWVLMVGVLRCVCIFLPFVCFQVFGYVNICLRHSMYETRPWCKAKIPLPYNYIQSHYWGVGFLRYFQLKELPNFLLASPILSLAMFSILHYVRSQPMMFFSLGFQASNGVKKSAASSSSDTVPGSNDSCSRESLTKMQKSHNLRQRRHMVRSDDIVESLEANELLEKPESAFIIPCTLHLGFMASTAFLVMHVQVATRFLSASPPLYWFASYMMVSPGSAKPWGYAIWAYSAAYILLGSLLFSNFYPFT